MTPMASSLLRPISGAIVPGAEWTVIRESGLGFHVNAKAMALTIKNAKTPNVAVCTVFRESHIGRLAAYPLMAASAGMVGLVLLIPAAHLSMSLPSADGSRGSGRTRSRSQYPPISRLRFCSTWRPRQSLSARSSWRSRADRKFPRAGSSMPRDGPPLTRATTATAARCCRSAAARATKARGSPRW